MIPKIIHYCWFGRGEMPESAKKCIASWHNAMPDWEYKLWNENNFDINKWQYCKEAYEAKKYAFVSDVARLYALYTQGGVYLDVDFVVLKSFENLLHHKAFAGIEGSKKKMVMMGVIASEPNGLWVAEQLRNYDNLHFILPNNSLDTTPNTTRWTLLMEQNGYIRDGKESNYKDLHIFTTDYFCPRQTNGDYLKTENTYCESISTESSWAAKSYKQKMWKILGPSIMSFIIKTKRRLFD